MQKENWALDFEFIDLFVFAPLGVVVERLDLTRGKREKKVLLNLET